MAVGFSKEVASKKAQEWANEQNEPFTVYKDPSGAYLATELSHFKQNPEAHRNCLQQGVFHPQQPEIENSPATEKIKYFVCGFSEDAGKTFHGKPEVFTESELNAERDKAADATDGNWDVIVITKFEIEQN